MKGITAILAIVGNGFIIYTIAFKRRLHVTNNWFVLSLAIADFCVGLFITPSELACTFYFRCDFRFQIAFYDFLLFASTLNLWAIGIDRYIGIVHSLRYTSLMTTKRLFAIVAMSWGISLLAAFVHLIWLFDVRITEKIKIDKYYRVVLDVFFGIFSCVVPLVIYLRILLISRKISRQTASQVTDVSYNQAPTQFRSVSNRHRRARRKSSAKVLGSVVILFVLFHSLNIYISFCSYFNLHSVNPLLHSISLLLVDFNSCVNFVVYAFMKNDIRMELRRLCRCGNSVDISDAREFSLNPAGNTNFTTSYTN